jgi:cytoskeletal protein CcmA (bactofilin family)
MWSNKPSESIPGDPHRGTAAAPSTQQPERVSENAGRVSNIAIIGKGMKIKGEIRSKESVHVDGEVEGNLYMSDCRLSVSREGRLGANVKAREIELMGIAEGDLEATSKITIRKGARLIGDLRAPGILIEEGAYVKGKIEIVNAPELTQGAEPQPTLRKAVGG